MKKKQIAQAPAHYTAEYLLSPQHPVTITLVGCGGTGSQMLNNLARMHSALVSLGHPGLHVTAWDDDEVTESNLGRQLFSPSELGINKAVALITRINRFFGIQWDAVPDKLTLKEEASVLGNILITAVDNVTTRNSLSKMYTSKFNNPRPERKRFYWMDLGNSKDFGQIIIGTCGAIEQPEKTKNTVSTLPLITDLYPDLQKYEDKDDTPSCSLAEALNKQDLFINSILAQYGANLLWKMFRDLKLEYHGLYLNLKTLQTNPIKV